MNGHPWDAVVVGGGPAGLSAALWLARYRRRTLVLDDGRPRNEAAWAVHGYPGLPDPEPEMLRRRLRAQALEAGAALEGRHVRSIDGEKDRFRVRLEAEDDAVPARRIVLAYGRQDLIPEIPGVRELYGSAVFHCPDCDGPVVTGATVGVLGHDRPAAALALYLLTWADRTLLLTNGMEPALEPKGLDVLERHGVDVVSTPIDRVDGSAGAVRVARPDSPDLTLDALFFHWGSVPTTSLAPTVGCECDPDGEIRVDPRTLETSVPGIYAAGDIIGQPHLAISAAAEGVRAALALHRSLLPEEFEL